MNNQDKKLDISLSTIMNLFKYNSIALTLVNNWYRDPIIVKELIKLYLEKGGDFYKLASISYILPMLYLFLNDTDGFKELLSKLTLEEQLYLFDFQHAFGNIDTIDSSFFEIAQIGLDYIFSKITTVNLRNPNSLFITTDINSELPRLIFKLDYNCVVSNSRYLYMKDKDQVTHYDSYEVLQIYDVLNTNVDDICLIFDNTYNKYNSKSVTLFRNEIYKEADSIFRKFNIQPTNLLLQKILGYKTKKEAEIFIIPSTKQLKLRVGFYEFRNRAGVSDLLAKFLHKTNEYLNPLGIQIEEGEYDNKVNFIFNGKNFNNIDINKISYKTKT